MNAVPTTHAEYAMAHNATMRGRQLEEILIFPLEVIGIACLWIVTFIVFVLAVIVMGIPDIARYWHITHM